MATALRAPGPRGNLLIGNLRAFRDDPLGFLMQCARDYGDVSHFRIGPQDIFLINHPDYIKDVLVTHHRNFIKGRGMDRAKHLLGEGLLTSNGDFHRRQRHLAQPAFHRQRIANYASIMTSYSVRLSDRWHAGDSFDITHEMLQLSLEIVAKALFDADVEASENEIAAAFMTCMLRFRSVPTPLSAVIDRMRVPSNRRFRKARQHLDDLIYGMIAERRRSGEDRGDLLSMLLDYGDAATGEATDGEVMTERQVRDEMITLILAGHETTAFALAWTWYLLEKNQEVEAKLHAELDSVLGGKLPTVDDLPRLRYTEMLLHESMRLFPPAWIMGRRALNPYPLGSYIVPAGGTVLISQYVTHHDPRFFPDPFRFDPERWTPEARAARPKFSYFPFGGGPHLCIGEPFSWMEITLVVATLAQKWRLRLAPGYEPELKPIIVLRPRGGIPMTLERRA